MSFLDAFRLLWKKRVDPTPPTAQVATPAKEALQHDRPWRARLEAVQRTSDQAVLEHVVWNDRHKKVCEAAARRITDAASQEHIAARHGLERARLAAVEALSDPPALGRLAKAADDPEVRLRAAAKLTDPALLGELATAASVDEPVRVVAIGRVTDQDLLGRLAGGNPSAAVRKAAVAGLRGDEPLLERLALHDLDVGVRLQAVSSMTAQDTLRRVAEQAEDSRTRRHAIGRVEDATARERLLSKLDSEAREIAERERGQLQMRDRFDMVPTGSARSPAPHRRLPRGEFVELYRFNADPGEDIARLEAAGIQVETDYIDDGWIVIVRVHPAQLEEARRISAMG